jgi:hypothetical protein
MHFREAIAEPVRDDWQFQQNYFSGLVGTAAFLSERPSCSLVIGLKFSLFNSSSEICSFLLAAFRLAFFSLFGPRRGFALPALFSPGG